MRGDLCDLMGVTMFTLSKNSMFKFCASCLIVSFDELIFVFFLLSVLCKIIPEKMMVKIFSFASNYWN